MALDQRNISHIKGHGTDQRAKKNTSQGKDFSGRESSLVLMQGMGARDEQSIRQKETRIIWYTERPSKRWQVLETLRQVGGEKRITRQG